MKIQQNNIVYVHTVPPEMVTGCGHGIFSPSPPIYQIYRKNSENFQNHGKSGIWVERGDFYHAVTPSALLSTPNTPNATISPPNNPLDSNTPKVRKSRGRVKKTSMDTDPYLLIGFDTEFKTPDIISSRSDIQEGKAKFQVLSYQFHAKTNTGEEWAGICCPQGDDRMTLSEFIVFALGSGAREHGIRNLPSLIYLVGHFTRADIPAFRDFKEMKGEMMNIRNTFSTVGASMRMDVMFPEGSAPITLSVGIRDTMLLTPATSKKLSALGELLKVPKKVLKTAEHDHEWLIRNMDYCRANHWEMYREYAITDATIAMLYGERVIDLYYEVQGVRKFPSTLSSIGVDLLTTKLTTCEPPLFNQLIGLESHQSKQYSKRLGYYIRSKKSVPLIEVDRYAKEATECYHGGRNEQFWFGPCFEDAWTDFDLQNAYPTAMALIGIPIWSLMYTTTDVDEFQPTTLGYVDIEFEFPESVRYPVLPVRTDNGLIFPRSGRSRCSAPEAFLAKRLGARLKIHFGLVVPTNPFVKPFADFTRDCIRYRAEAGKKSLKGLFWKEITNSTYGKTAQGLFPKRMYDLKEEGTKLLGPSKITNPYLAAYITSAVRAVLGELMNGLPSSKMIFSCTTDGFLTNATEAELLALSNGPIYKVFANARKDLTGDDSVLEIKHAIRKPLGWRTRGQATIIPGSIGEPGSDSSFVLAKGGIYLPKYLETVQQQNDKILQMFLNRTPECLVHVVGSVGMREIMTYDADLVEKSFTKRLGMEFDWKRLPAGVTSDPTTGHLVFNTVAWKSINQFQAIRDSWDEYVKERFTCLKTVEDFRKLSSYVTVRTSVSGDVKRYLKREDGDLKRLRMAVCSAWKHSKAGISHATTSHSAQDFADMLVLCGIPCGKTDVENGKKKPFFPNRVPQTPAVMKAIEDLKNFMPMLDVSELLFKVPNEDRIDLGSESSLCPFIEKLVQQGAAIPA